MIRIIAVQPVCMCFVVAFHVDNSFVFIYIITYHIAILCICVVFVVCPHLFSCAARESISWVHVMIWLVISMTPVIPLQCVLYYASSLISTPTYTVVGRVRDGHGPISHTVVLLTQSWTQLHHNITDNTSNAPQRLMLMYVSCSWLLQRNHFKQCTHNRKQTEPQPHWTPI